MQPVKQQRKADNCRLIPSSKFATRQTRESSSRRANFSKSSLPATARKGVACHECHAYSRKFSLLTPLLWVAAMFLLLLAVRSVVQNRSPRKWRDRETIEWGQPRPSLIQRWRIKMGRIRFRLPRLLQQQMPEIAPKPTPLAPATPPADPLKKPTQPMLALFGSTV